MKVDELVKEYTQRCALLADVRSKLWNEFRLHNEITVDAIARTQNHTKSSAKYFQLTKELQRLETRANVLNINLSEHVAGVQANPSVKKGDAS